MESDRAGRTRASRLTESMARRDTLHMSKRGTQNDASRPLRVSLGIVAVFALSVLGAAPVDSCTPMPGGTGGQVPTPYCGNGRRDSGEQCDSYDLAGKTCQSMDPKFVGGPLRCDDRCEYDTRACELPKSTTCGNGRIDPGEACDGNDLGGVGCDRVRPDATGPMRCLPNCQLDARGCIDKDSQEPASDICGDGILGHGEECDGKALSAIKCSEWPQPGWEGTEGTLECLEGSCFISNFNCIGTIEAHCGNGIVEPQFGEQCEGAVWGPSCIEAGFWTGSQNCQHCRWAITFCHGCLAGSRGGIFCR
jgi:hypothetical protein